MKVFRVLFVAFVGLSVLLPFFVGPSFWPFVTMISWGGFYFVALRVFRDSEKDEEMLNDVIESAVRSGYCALGEDFKEECRLLRGRVSRDECERCWRVRVGRPDPGKRMK